jgi:hypothetical protein
MVTNVLLNRDAVHRPCAQWSMKMSLATAQYNWIFCGKFWLWLGQLKFLNIYVYYFCQRLIVRYLKYDRRERKSVRSISREHKIQGFNLLRTLAWSNIPTSSINVLCYWDWFFSLSFRAFRGFLSDVFRIFSLVLDVDLSSLFIVGEPPHRV